MLGCSCSDARGFMEIKCAIVLYEAQTYGSTFSPEDGSTKDTVFDVVFQKRSTANYMSCAASEISVQSVRWPATRFTGSNVDQSCQSKSTCNLVDATVWVSPLCSVATHSAVCTDSYKDAACFPYCMAARRLGSGSDGLVLYNAPDWRSKVHLMDRDCAMKTQVDSGSTIPKVLAGNLVYTTDGSEQTDFSVGTR